MSTQTLITAAVAAALIALAGLLAFASEHQDEETFALITSLAAQITWRRSLPVPVIAAVNGVAAGAGANFALCCDFVVAARGASFIQAFSKIGLVPDCGGTWLLPRLVGRARALGLAHGLGPMAPMEVAVLRSAARMSAPSGVTPPLVPPQLTTSRRSPSLSSKAKVEAHPP